MQKEGGEGFGLGFIIKSFRQSEEETGEEEGGKSKETVEEVECVEEKSREEVEVGKYNACSIWVAEEEKVRIRGGK